MIKRLSCTLAQAVAKSINNPQYSVVAIAYGFELILTYLLGTSILFAISILCHQPMAWLAFILGFAPLRTTAGGFHANSRISCFLITAVVFSIALLVSFCLIWQSFVYLVISAITIIIVFWLSPVEANNKKLKKEVAMKNRKRSIVISGALFLIAGVFCVMNVVSALINLLYTGIAMAAVSLIIAKIVKHGKEGAL